VLKDLSIVSAIAPQQPHKAALALWSLSIPLQAMPFHSIHEKPPVKLNFSIHMTLYMSMHMISTHNSVFTTLATSQT